MKVISLEHKRRKKKAEEIVKVPLYDKVFIDENGKLTGNIIDYIDKPNHWLEEE
ncbi:MULTISPECIES: hypothetical protein [unclassified Virgibacillus]|uniref:hypothetical protein n=1 Tax=unclassified Virgibacillus TaxID=2620237 RepID=UPI000ADF4484|nr:MULTISPECIES: hypothetical protein [unclassified Virgibacillus]MBS7427988.1 hypothetical protein [Virgibacillus sp. 19R1-5]